MHHLAAFTASLTTPSNGDVAALTDDVISITNSHFLPQRPFGLIFAASMLVNQTRCRINTPTLRQISLPYIRPIITAAIPPTQPNLADYTRNPLSIRAQEELAVEITGTDVGAQQATVLMGLQTQFVPAPAGDITTFRGTSTTSAVANAWTTLSVNWADTLAAGNYAVIGMEVYSANAIAARLIFEGGRYRPGALSINDLGYRSNDMFRKGGLGLWGVFASTALPIVQVLSNSTDASHEVYLDIVPTTQPVTGL